MANLIVTDTTLRDGHQQPGVAFTLEDRLYIASMLKDLGVDVIEAGFPANSYDIEPVNKIAQSIRGPKISALARVVKSDIDFAYKALKPAADRGDAMLHVFISTSDMLIEHSLRSTPQSVLDKVYDMVSYARSLFGDVQFSPEDSTRTNPRYLNQVLDAAISAGATRINIPDTVGYADPEEFKGLVRSIKKKHPRLYNGNVILSVHCHNDLDNAVTNTVAGIKGGATQFEGTINGLGERAGNTDLATVIETLRTRNDLYRKLPSTSHINTANLTYISREVDRIAEMPTYDNRPITGTNAFRDSSGIHGKAVIRNPGSYHIVNAEDVGGKVELVIGPTSGTGISDDLLAKYGIEVAGEQSVDVIEYLKGQSIKFKDALTENEAIVSAMKYLGRIPQEDHLQVIEWGLKDEEKKPFAYMRVNFNGEQHYGESAGVGSIDALTSALQKAAGNGWKILGWEQISSNSGKEALAHTKVPIEYKGNVYWGRGRDPDIVRSGFNAIIDALNSAYTIEKMAEKKLLTLPN